MGPDEFYVIRVGDKEYQPLREITPEELTAIQEQLDYLNKDK